MSRDESDAAVRRPRLVPRPRVPPGPLGDLKDLVYELYLGAGAPSLDVIAAEIADDDRLPGAPGRDTIRRVIGSPDIPAGQHDATSVATVLARLARWDEADAAGRVRECWVRARMADPLGRPIADARDPFAFEVHRAIDAGAASAGLPVLPAYIPREHDRRLGEIVKRAVSGGSTMAVLVGGSSTGKTRACWEAIQSLPEGWRLWHPIAPERPKAAAWGLAAVGQRTVIWLNEAQHYLLTPGEQAGEEVASGLRELLRTPERAPVLILATLWPDYWSRLTADPAPGKEDTHAQARALLGDADIEVPDRFDAVALAAARAAADSDPRVAEAVTRARHGCITQFLAGIPALTQRYRSAPPTARAAVDAAVDARRLGAGPGLPHALLAAAAPGYLTDQQWDTATDDWLEQALAYTGEPCRGLSGPLTPIRPRPDEPHPSRHRYRLADHLLQAADVRPAGISPPDSLWEALPVHVDHDDLMAIATEAERRRLDRHAFRLYEAAAEAGRPMALESAVDMLCEHGQVAEAISWLQQRAGTGDRDAARLARDTQTEARQDEESIAFFKRLAEQGDNYATGTAALRYRRWGRFDEAITWLRDRAEAGDTSALIHMVMLMCQDGRASEAYRHLQARGETDLSGFPLPERLQSRHSRQAGHAPRAEAAAEHAQRERPVLVRMQSSDNDAATRWHNACWEAGDRMNAEAEHLRDAGDTDAAISLYLRAVEAGHPDLLWDGPLLSAADLLRESGRPDEARQLLRYGIEPGPRIARPWRARTAKGATARDREALALHAVSGENERGLRTRPA
jgi:tetratricopeptide (TPR) repeat protein